MRRHLKSKFLSLQFDIWTLRNCRLVFVMLHVTFIDPATAELYEFLLSSSRFPIGSHTGKAIRNFLNKTLSEFGITLHDVGSITLDGDSKGLKACKLMMLPFRVCLIHDIARAVLYALGLAGPASNRQNLEAASMIKEHKALASFAHKSVLFHDTLQSKQTAMRGVGKELEVVQMKGGKWGAQHDCLDRNLQLKPCINAAMSAILRDEDESDEDASDASDAESETLSTFSDNGEETNGSGSDNNDEAGSGRALTTVQRARKAKISSETFKNSPELVAALAPAKDVTMLFQHGSRHPLIHKLIPAQILLTKWYSTDSDFLHEHSTFSSLPVAKYQHTETDHIGTVTVKQVLKSELSLPAKQSVEIMEQQLEQRRFTKRKFPRDERAGVAWCMDPIGGIEEEAGKFF